MKAFFRSYLFALIIEAVLTVALGAVVLAGSVNFLIVLALAVSAVSNGWYLCKYLSERNTRVY
jgi:hypothetical protein